MSRLVEAGSFQSFHGSNVALGTCHLLYLCNHGHTIKAFDYNDVQLNLVAMEIDELLQSFPASRG